MWVPRWQAGVKLGMLLEHGTYESRASRGCSVDNLRSLLSKLALQAGGLLREASPGSFRAEVSLHGHLGLLMFTWGVLQAVLWSTTSLPAPPTKGIGLMLSPEAFFRPNIFLAEALVETVLELAGASDHDVIWDA